MFFMSDLSPVPLIYLSRVLRPFNETCVGSLSRREEEGGGDVEMVEITLKMVENVRRGKKNRATMLTF